MKGRVKGKHLFIFSGATYAQMVPIAHSTECGLSISSDTLSLCAHRGVKRQRTSRISWSVNCSKLNSSVIEEYSGFNISAFIGQPFLVGFDVLTEELIAAGVPTATPNAETTLVGAVIVESIVRDAPLRGLESQRITFRGTGELGILGERDGFPYIFPIEL